MRCIDWFLSGAVHVFVCICACVHVCVCSESLLGKPLVLLQLIIIDLHLHFSTTCRLRQTHMDGHPSTHKNALSFPFLFLTDSRGGLRGLLYVRVCVTVTDSSPIVTVLYTQIHNSSQPSCMADWPDDWLAGGLLACQLCR